MTTQELAQDGAEIKPFATAAHKFWVAMFVDVRDHEVVGFKAKTPKPVDPKRDAWTPFQMWFWLLCEAARRPRQRVLQGRAIALNRGQLAVSYRFMAREANWGIKTVRVFFERLQRFQMVTLSVTSGTQLSLNFSQLNANSPEKGTGITLVSICNYNKYQHDPQTKGTRGAQQGHRKGTGRAQDSTENIDTEIHREDDLVEAADTSVDDAPKTAVLVRLDDHRSANGNTFGLTVNQFDRYYALASGWGRKPGSMPPLVPLDRSLTDSNLLSGMARFDGRPADLVRLAVDLALSEMEARRDDEVRSGALRGQSGLGPCANYFSRTLNTHVDRLLMERAKREADARAEMIVQQAVLEKRLNGVEKGGSGSRSRRSSWDDIATSQYDEASS